MRVAVITIAGVSSRFNEGIPENEKKHKIIYYEKDMTNTLLYHLLEKCMYADRIVLVGGNRFDEVKIYCDQLPEEMKHKIDLVYNDHYADLASGYSLYVGLNTIFEKYSQAEDVLFVEGDLDVDKESFDMVVATSGNALTYSYEPIYANKAVVLYRNGEEHYKYEFNSDHGLLSISEPFSVILNSGQMWKFGDLKKLQSANDSFYANNKSGTNLIIIQNYIDSCNDSSFELVGLKRWTNCNTRQDYRKILTYWEEENK